MNLRVLMPVADNTVVSVLELPDLSGVDLKESLLWIIVMVRPLIEDHLWVIDDSLHGELIISAIGDAASAILIL